MNVKLSIQNKAYLLLKTNKLYENENYYSIKKKTHKLEKNIIQLTKKNYATTNEKPIELGRNRLRVNFVD